MFKSLVSVATLLAMFLHAVLGCCAHHAHAGHAKSALHEETLGAEAEAHSHHGCCHGHSMGGEDDSDRPPATEGEPCGGEGHGPHGGAYDEETCQFVGPPKVELCDAHGWVLPAVPAVAEHSAQVGATGRMRGCPLGFSRSGLPPTLSVRDLTQVWRI